MQFSDHLIRPRQVLYLMLVLALIGLGMWFFMRPENVDWSQAPSVTARELAGAYEASESAADQAWGGKHVRVMGKVVDAGQSPSGYIYLRFAEPVICILERGQGAKAKKLVAGAWIEVGGTVRGLGADGVALHASRLLR